MKSRKIMFAGLLLLSALTGATAQTRLSFNPAKGSEYRHRIEMTQNITSMMMGQKIPMENTIMMSYDMAVTGKSDRETTVRFIYREISFIMASAMMRMAYDSKKPAANPSEIDKMLAGALGCFIDKAIDLRIAADGSVLSVTGMDAIVEEMDKTIAGSGPMGAAVGASLKSQFGNDAIKNMFEQSMKVYPSKPVKPGDSWEVDQSASVGGMKMDIKSEYTLRTIEKGIADVSMKSAFNMVTGSDTAGGMAGTQTGTMQIDVKTGMQSVTEITQALKGTNKINGTDIPMELTSKTKITITEK